MSTLNIKTLFLENIQKLIGLRITNIYKQQFFDMIEDLDDIFIIEFNNGNFDLHIQCIVRIRKKGNIILTSSDDYLDKDYKEIEYEDSNNLMKIKLKQVLNEIMKYKVIYSKINTLGDISIYFEEDYVIEIFIDAPKNGEVYRFIIEKNHYILEQKYGKMKYVIQKK